MDAPIGALTVFVYIVAIVLVVAGMWRMFEKAGQPGWVCLIPIVNLYFLLKVAQRPGWLLILAFIPILNLVLAILIASDLASVFGKGGLFAVGLLLLPVIFYPILGFGDARYLGHRTREETAAVFD